MAWYQKEDLNFAPSFKNKKLEIPTKLPAILYIKIKKGKVILSGVHFEYSADLLDPKNPLLPLLKKEEPEKNKFLIDVFTLLGLEVSSLNKFKF